MNVGNVIDIIEWAFDDTPIEQRSQYTIYYELQVVFQNRLKSDYQFTMNYFATINIVNSANNPFCIATIIVQQTSHSLNAIPFVVCNKITLKLILFKISKI